MWLACAVLDINIMIMICYIQDKLKPPKDGESSVDWDSYIAFCNFITPSLLEKQIFSRGSRDIKSCPVKQGLISTPGYDTL